MANACPLGRLLADFVRGVERSFAGTSDRSEGEFLRLDGVFDLVVSVSKGRGIEIVQLYRTLVVTAMVTAGVVLFPAMTTKVSD